MVSPGEKKLFFIYKDIYTRRVSALRADYYFIVVKYYFLNDVIT